MIENINFRGGNDSGELSKKLKSLKVSRSLCHLRKSYLLSFFHKIKVSIELKRLKSFGQEVSSVVEGVVYLSLPQNDIIMLHFLFQCTGYHRVNGIFNYINVRGFKRWYEVLRRPNPPPLGFFEEEQANPPSSLSSSRFILGEWATTIASFPFELCFVFSFRL